ncbi:hypothetical protein [Brucella sp. 22210]|uniref:hypothetical protein n=1 Tax=Brucella sp. 22210 TaxID=3453892 RepID=UPI003F879775
MKENKFYVVFNIEGFLSASYQSAIYDDPDSIIPSNAIELTQQEWEDLYDNQAFRRYVSGEIVAYAAPEPTPEEKRERMPNLSARQIRLGLLHLGKLSAVNAAIGALPEPDKSEAQIEWDYASEFHRLNHLIVQLIPILGLTDEQVDIVWEQFSTV